jgi:hypothetical protein
MGLAVEHVTTRTPPTIELVAGPFPRMSTIAAFRDRIATLPGVVSAELEKYGAGSISLRVRHTGAVPFAVQVRGLRELGVEVTFASDARIEVRVRPAA